MTTTLAYVADIDIERVLEGRVGAPARVLGRRPSRYATSHVLEELTVLVGEHPPIG